MKLAQASVPTFELKSDRAYLPEWVNHLIPTQKHLIMLVALGFLVVAIVASGLGTVASDRIHSFIASEQRKADKVYLNLGVAIKRTFDKNYEPRRF